jgi:hypothetical protein
LPRRRSGAKFLAFFKYHATGPFSVNDLPMRHRQRIENKQVSP